MADLDTQAKRVSGMHLACPWRLPAKVPSGSFTQGERQAVNYLYSGILAEGATTTGLRRYARPTRKILVTIKGARFLVPEDQLHQWLDDKEDEIVEQAIKPVAIVSKKARIIKPNTLAVPKVVTAVDDSWVVGAIAELNKRVSQRIAAERKRLQDEDDEEVMLLLL